MDDAVPAGRSPATPLVWAILLVFLAVLLASLLGIFTRPIGRLATFWPANALMLGMFLRSSRPLTPWHWVAGMAGFVVADAVTGADLQFNLLMNFGNLVSVAAGVFLYRHIEPDERILHRPASVLRMLVNVTGAAVCCGVIGGGIYVILFNGNPLEGAKFWFASELLSYMAILPIILTWPPRVWTWRAFRAPPDPRQAAHTLLPLAALAFSCIAAIILGGPGAVSYPVPALLWCALSYPLFATSLIAFGYILFSLASIDMGSLAVFQTFDDWDAQMSIRLGITLIAIGPLIVASVSYGRRQLMSRLRSMATTDQLTGVSNRGGYFERADKALQRLAATGRPVALLMIDIDGFKGVNDTFGHAAGDETLIAFASAIRAQLPADAPLGRLGGEEFSALLPEASEDAARQIADRVRIACGLSAVCLPDGRRVSTTVSVGIVHLPVARGSPGELLATADRALYRAKQTGRDRVEIEPMPQSAADMPLGQPA